MRSHQNCSQPALRFPPLYWRRSKMGSTWRGKCRCKWILALLNDWVLVPEELAYSWVKGHDTIHGGQTAVAQLLSCYSYIPKLTWICAAFSERCQICARTEISTVYYHHLEFSIQDSFRRTPRRLLKSSHVEDMSTYFHWFEVIHYQILLKVTSSYPFLKTREEESPL